MIVWEVKWGDGVINHIRLNTNVYKLLLESLTYDYMQDMWNPNILFSSRNKAEAYIEEVSEDIGKLILDDLINNWDEDEECVWKHKKYEKVRWDEVSQEIIDLHEEWQREATTYWIAPEHAYDRDGVNIAGICKREVR